MCTAIYILYSTIVQDVDSRYSNPGSRSEIIILKSCVCTCTTVRLIVAEIDKSLWGSGLQYTEGGPSSSNKYLISHVRNLPLHAKTRNRSVVLRKGNIGRGRRMAAHSSAASFWFASALVALAAVSPSAQDCSVDTRYDCGYVGIQQVGLAHRFPSNRLVSHLHGI